MGRLPHEHEWKMCKNTFLIQERGGVYNDDETSQKWQTKGKQTEGKWKNYSNKLKHKVAWKNQNPKIIYCCSFCFNNCFNLYNCGIVIYLSAIMCGLLYDTIALREKRESEVIDQMNFSSHRVCCASLCEGKQTKKCRIKNQTQN